MGLLDFFSGSNNNASSDGQQTPDFQTFINSPQGMAMAAALLQGGGYSTKPITLGESLGNGMQAMQQASNNDVKNQYTKAMTQQLKQTLALKSVQQQGMQNLLNHYRGQQQATPQASTASSQEQPLFMQPGASMQTPQAQVGLLNMQQTTGGADPALPGLLMQAGFPDKAIDILSKQGNEYGKPQSVLDEQGHPKLIQTDKYGNVRELKGYLPQPKSQMGLTVDPVTGQITFAQGAGVLPDGWLKDPKMGPARGGQGGTYTDSKTGQVISTDTSKMASQDQQTIAAMQRVEPQIDRIVNTLPQFQHANVKAQSYLQGVGNTFFGTDYRLPSKQAEGEAALESSPEALLKAFGLNVTDQSLSMMRKTVEPMRGESPSGYKERVLNQLQEMRMFQSQSKNRLMNGIVLNDENTHQEAAKTTPNIVHFNYIMGKGLVDAKR
jgi:hypothetical protein